MAAYNSSRITRGKELYTIKIVKPLTSSVLPFPYGTLSSEDRQFIIDNVNKTFIAEKHNMNYYHIPEVGCLVHIYNTSVLELNECAK